MRVLVVENNIEMRRFIKSVIGEIADEIYESPGGEEAVDVYRSVRPDWVVMDIFRKPENGLTVAASIKQMDADANIVFVSNYTDERTRGWAMSSGGAALFGKDDLLGLVEFLSSKKLGNGQL